MSAPTQRPARNRTFIHSYAEDESSDESIVVAPRRIEAYCARESISGAGAGRSIRDDVANHRRSASASLKRARPRKRFSFDTCSDDSDDSEVPPPKRARPRKRFSFDSCSDDSDDSEVPPPINKLKEEPPQPESAPQDPQTSEAKKPLEPTIPSTETAEQSANDNTAPHDVDYALSLVSRTVAEKIRASEAKNAELQAQIARLEEENDSLICQRRYSNGIRDSIRSAIDDGRTELPKRDKVVSAAKKLTDLGNRVTWKRREEAMDVLKEAVDEHSGTVDGA